MTARPDSWDSRIHLAEELARKTPATKEILTFYTKLLESQQQIEEFLRSRRNWLPSGNLSDDMPVLMDAVPEFLHKVEAHGPVALAQEARRLLTVANQEVERTLHGNF
jgi:hypothetical protein